MFKIIFKRCANTYDEMISTSKSKHYTIKQITILNSKRRQLMLFNCHYTLKKNINLIFSSKKGFACREDVHTTNTSTILLKTIILVRNVKCTCP